MRRVILVAALVVLLILDVVGVTWLLAVGGIGLAFAAVGRGGMWLPSVLIGIMVDAGLIWLTVIVGKNVRSKP